MRDDGGCERCGHPNAPGQRFCGGCGGPIVRRCGGCGGENPPGFRFCGSCGRALTAEVPSTAGEQREERRWATVVFADLSGFTRLSERTDPEDVRSLVDRCVARMAAIVDAHGGWFDRVLGDGVLAVFGADVAHGDDAERAVRAAIELRRCSIEYADDFAHLPLSIGINTGEVMFAAVGPASRRDLTVMGDTVNTAARLQAAAGAGDILVGEETWRATRGAVQFQAVEPVHAKGKQEPVRAWLAIAAHELSAERPVSDVPLVGRDAELSVLTATWSRVAAERRPHLVTVLGPAGIGKTKLSREFVRAVEASGGRVARGRCLPYGESTGYGAFSLAVRDAAGVLATGDVDEARASLRRLVRSLLPEREADEIESNLSTLVGLTSGTGADRQALFFSARRFVEALARERPTLLVFEDIHWADPSLLDLIETLATRCRDAPVLLLTLARPELLEASPRWGGGVSGYAALALEPLGEDAARQLAALHLGEAEGSATAARLAAVGEGNPLFIEELSASVVERATDVDDELPTNVRAIIAARIDALPPPERAVLLDAAVVGKVFWRGALGDLGHPELDAALDALDRRDLVRREPVSRFEGDREYTFRHILIRDVAYATLPRTVRRQRHAAIARFIEQVAPDRSVESASTLAHHWGEAGETERAVDYLVAAAARAGDAWAGQEAVQLYSEALTLLPPDDLARRRTLRLARGKLLVQSAFYSEATEDLDAVLPELEGLERAEALLVRGNAAVWLMDGHRARSCAEEALALATPLEPELVGPALALVASAGSIDGRLDSALEMQARALEAWRPHARPRQLADHLGMMALVSYWVGAHDDAIEQGRRSYDLAVQHRSVPALLQGGSHLAAALTGAGRHEEALELFEKIVAQGREYETTPRLTSRTMNMMATALREIGEDDEARLRNEEAIECARQASFDAAMTQGGIDLVFGAIATGGLGEAERAWPALQERVEGLAGWHQWLGRGRLAQARAELALAQGDPAAAAELAAGVAAQSSEVGRPKYEALGRATLGVALGALGRPAQGLTELARANDIASRLGHPPTSWRVGADYAELLARSGREHEADTTAQAVRSTVAAFADGLSPLRRERFLASARVAALLARLP